MSFEKTTKLKLALIKRIIVNRSWLGKVEASKNKLYHGSFHEEIYLPKMSIVWEILSAQIL